MRTAPLDDYEQEEPRGLWARIKEKVGFGEYEDEIEDLLDEDGGRRNPVTLRVHAPRVNRVSVWLAIQSFENAQQAADGLKDGRQQIVNLEKAAPEVTCRVIDFLSGVTYALDGSVEKVGEKVYLFTPANYAIDVENSKDKITKGSFFGS